ncbi:thermonuclease family protein [Campylobacter blaseri]|uniref:thermonuclease family protein n=1 Tax=Campylobacter blaseri TaxID=2042961 RepID=UPI001F4ED361|nr:thermonuclease family protein [Campylobacter blaseri]
MYRNDGWNYNIEIAKQGYAVAYKKGKYTKDKALAHQVNKAQGIAANSKFGLWKDHYSLMKYMANN